MTFFISCKDESRPTPEYRESYVEEVAANRDVIATVRTEEELSEFAAALNETIKMSVQFETDTYTIFAPNNEAFSLDGYPEDDAAHFRELVEYHIVGEKLMLDDLRNRLAATEEPHHLVTLTGEKLQIALEGDRIALTDEMGNTAYIVRSIDAINGMVHVMDNTLFPEQRQAN